MLMGPDIHHHHFRTRRAHSRQRLDLWVDEAIEHLELLCDPDPLLDLLRSGDWPSELEEPVAELTELVRRLETRDQMIAAVGDLRPRLQRWSRIATAASARIAS